MIHFKKPLIGAFTWGGCGLIIGSVGPQLLAKMDLIYSPSFMTTVLCTGAVCICTPTGAIRGALGSTHALTVQSGAAGEVGRQIYRSAVASAKAAGTDTPSHTALQDIIRESTTSGSLLGTASAGSRVIRLLVTPFLPSTAFMLEKVEATITKQTELGTGGDEEVLAAATQGLVEGYIQDKTDSITMLALVAVCLVAGGGLFMDAQMRKAAQKLALAKQKIQDTKQKIEASLSTLDESRKLIRPTVERGKANIDSLVEKHRIKDKLQKMKDLHQSVQLKGGKDKIESLLKRNNMKDKLQEIHDLYQSERERERLLERMERVSIKDKLQKTKDSYRGNEIKS